MLSDLADGYKYDKSETVASPIIVKNTLVDYAAMVKREGGKSKVSNVLVIDMDAIKNSLGIVPTPQSMDVAFVVTKSSEYENGSNKSIRLTKKYILADFKFNVTSPDKVDKNISNDDIKGKFDFSISYIREKDINIPCCNIAYFIFNDTNYQQIRNRWSRRNLNSPKNMAVKQSDFETLF
jgi:hypothetical protein